MTRSHTRIALTIKHESNSYQIKKKKSKLVFIEGYTIKNTESLQFNYSQD